MNQDQKYKKFKISDELIENIIKLIDESNDSKIVNNFKNSHHASSASNFWLNSNSKIQLPFSSLMETHLAVSSTWP